jgi:hypothetical protein
LNFIPAQGKWFLFTPAPQGFRRRDIIDDDALPFTGSVLNPQDDGRKTIN